MLIDNHYSVEVIEMDRIIADPLLENTCRRLSYGGTSGMNSALNHYKTIQKTEGRHIEAKGIFAKLMQEHVGWALWTRESDNYSFTPQFGFVAFQIYVAQAHRRRGVGSKLFYTAHSLLEPHEKLRAYLYGEPGFFEPLRDKGLCSQV